MTFVTEVLLAIFFWFIFLTQVKFSNEFNQENHDALVALKIVDHYLPLIILVTDYIISNPVFVLRHVIFSFGYGLLFMFVNLIVSLAGTPTYATMDWRSVQGVLIPLALVLAFPLIHVILYYVTRFRLQRDPFKNQTILKVLQLAGIYTLNSYRFSQYSAGTNGGKDSLSLKDSIGDFSKNYKANNNSNKKSIALDQADAINTQSNP